jgi:hypothetical protein
MLQRSILAVCRISIAQNNILWFAGLGLLYLVLDGTLFGRIGKQTSAQG